jgi:uncharacterized protein (TIGR00106 family)
MVGAMIVALSIAPSGPPLHRPAAGADPSASAGADGAGVSDAVAAAVQVLRDSGLPCQTNAMFTNLEGEWDEIFAAVKRAVDVVARDYPRVSLVLKADIRAGASGELDGKVTRLEEALHRRSG